MGVEFGCHENEAVVRTVSGLGIVLANSLSVVVMYGVLRGIRKALREVVGIPDDEMVRLHYVSKRGRHTEFTQTSRLRVWVLTVRS